MVLISIREDCAIYVIIYSVPEETTKLELHDYAISQMLGPFEIVGITEKLDEKTLSRKVSFENSLNAPLSPHWPHIWQVRLHLRVRNKDTVSGGAL